MASLWAGQAHVVIWVWTIAACAELVFIVIEPAHLTYHALLTYRYLTGGETPWERVPIDVGYTEKRWHRLLMIALAMLPSFTTENVRPAATRARMRPPPSPPNAPLNP